MSDPWTDFAARITEPAGTNVYPTMVSAMVPPAIIIVPDDPWVETEAYAYDTERYLAICISEASDPASAMGRIHSMVHAVREAGGEGWEIGQASGVRTVTIPDDGTRYLGSWVSVTYRDCAHTVGEES